MSEAARLIADEIAKREDEIDRLRRECEGLRVALDVLEGVADRPVIHFRVANRKVEPPPAEETVYAAVGDTPSPAPEGEAKTLSPRMLVLQALEDHGARKGWVKLTYEEISNATGLTAPSISPALQELAAVAGLKIHKVTKGALRGNHFTFSARPWPEELGETKTSDQEAAPEPAKREEPDADEGQDRDVSDDLLGMLLGIKDKIGLASFQLKFSRIMTSLKCSEAQMKEACDTLKREGHLSSWSLGGDRESIIFNLAEGK